MIANLLTKIRLCLFVFYVIIKKSFFGKENNKVKNDLQKEWVTPEISSNTIYSDILEKSGHLAIAGSSGSGKSVLIQELLQVLLCKSPNDVGFILIDTKQIELYQYKNIPHCMCYANTYKKAEDALQDAVLMLEERYKKMQSENSSLWSGSTIYIVIDECADIMCSESIKQNIGKIAELGIQAKIKLIMSTQVPNEETLPEEIIRSCDRIGLHCSDSTESKKIIGCEGAENLPKNGYGIWLNTANKIKIEIPMTDHAEQKRIIEHWKNQ